MAKNKEMSDKGLEAVVRENRFGQVLLNSMLGTGMLVGVAALVTGTHYHDQPYIQGVWFGTGMGAMLTGATVPLVFRKYLFNSATRPATNKEAYGVR